MLIDFRELIGEHSGENMAEVVWQTLQTYGLVKRVCHLSPSITITNVASQVIAFVMDNALNNTTMVEAIETRCRKHGIDFSATRSRLRCMPHTCHLAVLKVPIS
jgi:hypothetical protein